MNSLLLVALMLGNDVSEAEPQADSGKLETIVLAGDQAYPIKLGQGEMTTVNLPFTCLLSWFPRKHVSVSIDPRFENYLHVISDPADPPPIGYEVQGMVACNQRTNLALKIIVVPPGTASPRVDVVWSTDDKSLLERRVDAATEEVREIYAKRIANIRASRQVDLLYLMQNARKGVSTQQDRSSGRDDLIVVHVDHKYRIGDLGMLDFRVQNQRGVPARIDSIEVAGVASKLEQVIDLDPASLNTLPDDGAVLLAERHLKPGETVNASVAFPWPGDTRRFKLTVRVTVDQQHAIEVADINY